MNLFKDLMAVRMFDTECMERLVQRKSKMRKKKYK